LRAGEHLSESDRPCLTQLSDGRVLAYAEYGDPDGVPIVFMHGIPSSRLAGSMLPESACRRGIRLVAPDRPGYGHSDVQPDRTILDWARDVGELADYLRFDQIAVLGISGAVPYVLACAVEMPERLSHVALLSGLGLLNQPDTLVGMNRESVALYTLAVRSPRLGRLWMKMLAQAARRSPMLVYRQQLKYLPEADRVIFEATALGDLRLTDFAEAFRQGSTAAAHEAVLHVSDWGFRLRDIGVSVFLWQGGLDRHHPPAMGRALAAAMPDVRYALVPDAGAFGFVPRMDEVFDQLLGWPAHSG
jgi:pimeloyl-ACP methyl ester carboxylesterase